MKKSLSISLLIFLTIVLLSSCSGNNNTFNSSPSATKSTNEKASETISETSLKLFKGDLALLESIATSFNFTSNTIDYDKLSTNGEIDNNKVSDYFSKNQRFPRLQKETDYIEISLEIKDEVMSAKTNLNQLLPDSLVKDLSNMFYSNTNSEKASRTVKAYPLDIELMEITGLFKNELIAPLNKDINGYGDKYQNYKSKNIENILFPIEKGKPGHYLILENYRVIYTGTDVMLSNGEVIHTSS